MSWEGDPTPRRGELYVRSLQPDGYCQQQATILDRIAGLVADGPLTGRDIHVAGCQVPASVAAANTAPGRMIARRLARFEEWAARNDCTLGPALERRVVEDTLGGASYRAVRLPAILLAEFHGEDLLCVTPHRDGETVLTVPDRVAQLAAGDPTEFEPLPGAVTASADRRAATLPPEPHDGDGDELSPSVMR